MLHLIRHGESTYNAACGAPGSSWEDPNIFDAKLTDLGVRQVRGPLAPEITRYAIGPYSPRPAHLDPRLVPSLRGRRLHLSQSAPRASFPHARAPPPPRARLRNLAPQASAVGRKLIGIPDTALWVTSPLTRAIQTCMLARSGRDGATPTEPWLTLRPELAEHLVTTGDVGRPRRAPCKFSRPLRPSPLPTAPPTTNPFATHTPSCRSLLQREFPDVRQDLEQLEELWWFQGSSGRNCAVNFRLGQRETKQEFKARRRSSLPPCLFSLASLPHVPARAATLGAPSSTAAARTRPPLPAAPSGPLPEVGALPPGEGLCRLRPQHVLQAPDGGRPPPGQLRGVHFLALSATKEGEAPALFCGICTMMAAAAAAAASGADRRGPPPDAAPGS